MRKNDQYFKPGDKVLRVGGHECCAGGPTWNELHPEDPVTAHPQYGVVYCVEDFWEGPRYNAVMLVGFGGWRHHGKNKCGWNANAFRKVDEIKLCVRAAEKMREPVEANGAG